MRVSAQRRRLPLLAELCISPRFSPATDTRKPPSGRRVSQLSVRCGGCEVGSVSPFSQEGGKP